MRAAIVGLVLALVAGSAEAATWTAEMQEDEGGPVLVASATATNSPGNPSILSVMCFEQAMVRYDPVVAEDSDIALAATSDFTFTSGDSTVTRPFQYEEMDGMFATYIPGGDALINLLVHGSEVTIADPAGVYPVRTFALDGSSEAIGTVLAKCGP